MANLNKIPADSVVDNAVRYLLTSIQSQVGGVEVERTTVKNGGYPCDDNEIQIEVAFKEVTLTMQANIEAKNVTN